MSKKIAWTVRAKDDLRAIDQRTAMNILHGVARYAQTGKADVIRLQDVDPPEFRLRLGNYRVRFHEFGGEIEILRVLHRSEAYS